MSGWVPLNEALDRLTLCGIAPRSAQAELRARLHSGELTARAAKVSDCETGLDYSGTLVARGFWENSELTWDPSDRATTSPINLGGSFGHSVAEGVAILRVDLDRVWPLPKNGQSKDRGGRPRELDWDGALIHAAHHIGRHGVVSESRLIKIIEAWFEDQGARVPKDKKSAREMAKRVLAQLGGEAAARR